MEISPITQIHNTLLEDHDITLSIKRDDLVGGPAQGNKYRKLRGWFDLVESQGCKTVVSFGGAFSNHLYALAWTAHQREIHSIGYVRGEEDISNPTLKSCRHWGMDVRYLTRRDYKERKHLLELEDHPGTIIIPEGGTGPAGEVGAIKLGHEILQQGDYTHWACAAGTCTTARGLVAALPTNSEQHLLIFDVLKRTSPCLNHAFVDIIPCALGGFAKTTPRLLKFLHEFHSSTGIYLDPIYTGKMMLGLFALIKDGKLPRGSHVLAIHTGGHQGIRAYNYRFNQDLPCPKWIEQLD